jgi:hypothetical protein
MTGLLRKLSLALVVAMAVGCHKGPDVDKVPVGAEVDVTRDDGGVVRGTLAGRDEQSVKVDVGPVTRSVPRDEIAAVDVVEPGRPAPLPEVARFREITLPEDTRLTLRLDSPVASNTSHVGDPVEATLHEAVIADGTTVLPAGSIVTGEVTEAVPSGKVKGRAVLAVRFRGISVARSDEEYDIAARFAREADSTKGQDAAKIALPAAGGALVGALLGGKRGAAIGTIVGGGAGTAAVLATAGPEIALPRGTVLSLELGRTIDVRVPIVR